VLEITLLLMTDPPRPISVLIVEDNPGDVLMIRQALAGGSIRVRVAVNGDQAVQIMTEPDFRADVVILDLNIPKISGFSILQRTRPTVQVVVFSSSSNPLDRQRSLELGAREFVQKPSDLDEYRRAVSNIVRRWVPDRGSG
jgi:two-component system response regulator